MSEQRGRAEGGLIQGAYLVDGTSLLVGEGGGLPAYAVTDLRGGRPSLMAVQADWRAPARHDAIMSLTDIAIDNLLTPLAFGAARNTPTCLDGGPALYIVCPRPPGPALDATIGGIRSWREGDLLDCVLRPVALALGRLAERRVTHRGIRPGNLFQARHGAPVTLGCAWAAPAASQQPAIFEPPYAALCHPAGRGEGSIADDIYALGVLLITLASGRVPLADLAPEEALRRRLEKGSFLALTEKVHLPAMIVDLVRGMLAEDPAHRPPPALLADPLAARARRVTSRPPARAQQSLDLGGLTVWNARGLAHALARDPDPAAALQRGFGVDTWLRRSLGDPVLARRLDEVVRPSAAAQSTLGPNERALMVMMAVTTLDPLAPLCWRGTILFPDGLGPVLAAQAAPIGSERPVDSAEDLTGLIESDAVDVWNALHLERSNPSSLQRDGPGNLAILRQAGWAGGMARLRYTLNRLLPCRSRLLAGHCVVALSDLLPALEAARAAQSGQGFGSGLVLDRETGAFIATQMSGRVDADLMLIAETDRAGDPDGGPPGHAGLAQLRVLALVQERMPPLALPLVAQLASVRAQPALAVWRNRSHRAAREAALLQASQRGQLIAMLRILEDAPARQADSAAAATAESELRAIGQELSDLQASQPFQHPHARLEGEQVAAALGVMALVTALLVMLLG